MTAGLVAKRATGHHKKKIRFFEQLIATENVAALVSFIKNYLRLHNVVEI